MLVTWRGYQTCGTTSNPYGCLRSLTITLISIRISVSSYWRTVRAEIPVPVLGICCRVCQQVSSRKEQWREVFFGIERAAVNTTTQTTDSLPSRHDCSVACLPTDQSFGQQKECEELENCPPRFFVFTRGRDSKRHLNWWKTFWIAYQYVVITCCF